MIDNFKSQQNSITTPFVSDTRTEIWEGLIAKQSRAQSSPAPRSAVGRRGKLGHGIRAVPVLVRMLGFEKLGCFPLCQTDQSEISGNS